MFPPLQSAIGSAVALALATASSGSLAAERLEGPYAAEVRRVIDGDTLGVTVAIWLQQEIEVLVRVRGIDAPELRGDCDLERIRADEATQALRRLVAAGAVRLTQIEGDKYYGRVIADVTTPAGEAVGPALVAAGLARPYDGGTRRGWCAVGSLE